MANCFNFFSEPPRKCSGAHCGSSLPCFRFWKFVMSSRTAAATAIRRAQTAVERGQAMIIKTECQGRPDIITILKFGIEEMKQPESCSTKLSDNEIGSLGKESHLNHPRNENSISLEKECEAERKNEKLEGDIMKWFQDKDIRTGYPEIIRNQFESSQKLGLICRDEGRLARSQGLPCTRHKFHLNTLKAERKSTLAL